MSAGAGAAELFGSRQYVYQEECECGSVSYQMPASMPRKRRLLVEESCILAAVGFLGCVRRGGTGLSLAGEGDVYLAELESRAHDAVS